MNDNTIKISQELKNKVLRQMQKMQAFVKEYPKADLPNVSNDFILSKDLLEKGDFNLAVCGKVKNGKSSLINALIGRKLLPVCTDVATSRVFKISHADNDSFYVVYANGDKKEIKEEQLASYGSQAEIDENGQIEADKTIAYIEVKTKLNFLPKGVSIIDTPGIGSTYPQHTAITKQYLKMADAALFVANPTPLEKLETDFLKEIVEITPNLIFVTTKIDENGNESVEKSITENIKKIKECIGKKLYRDVSMLKMSSTILLSATEAKDKVSADFILETSGYDIVKEEILKTIFLTQGYYRAGIGYNALVKYYQTLFSTLQNRLNGVKKTGAEYQAMLDEYEKARNVFTEQMGDSKRKNVLDEVEMILKTMEYDFNKLFSSSGELVTKYDIEINNLSSETVTSYSEGLGDRLVTDAQESWNNLTGLVYQKMLNAVNRYNEECQMLLPQSIHISDPNSGIDPEVSDVKFRDKIAAARTEMLTAGMISTAATTLAGAVYYFAPAMITPALPILAPALVILGVGTLIWGAISGRRIAIERHLAKAKDQLKEYVRKTIAECKRQLVETSLQDNKYQSLYQGFLLEVREQAKKSLTDIYEKYKKELDAMKKALADSKQNPKIIEAYEYMLEEWQKNKSGLQDIRKQLESVKLN